MPARLKSFELHGYKTFASRSEFQFSDGITAIVGPNGSGKSNIADALRWVLGEQSFGLLRAKKTEDMIFAGSENRPRAGMASATIVFDNEDGWLPIDFSEVGITRRAYRDGENEYLLNGQRVRLKDISEVLAQSGLAERTYTIIGQGLVDAALALRAEERRRLFEEAAGIGLHRSRREEAIKRLDTTRRNFERVHDILAELQPRLRSLERQAKRAQEYNQMREDLKVILREWYGYHWHRAQSELVESQSNAKIQEEAFQLAQTSQQNLDIKLSDYRLKINDVREKINSWHKELTALHQNRETLSRNQAVNSERLRSLLQQMEQQSEECAKSEESIGIQENQLANSTLEVARLEQEYKDTQQSAVEVMEKLKDRQIERAKLEQVIQQLQEQLTATSTRLTEQQVLSAEKVNHLKKLEHDLNRHNQDILGKKSDLSAAMDIMKSMLSERTEAEEKSGSVKVEIDQLKELLLTNNHKRQELSDQANVQQTKIAKFQAEINVLEEAEKNLTGYDEGARILIQAMKENKIEGAIGSLGSRLSVPEEYETAVAAVMGEYIDSLVMESLGQTEPALDLIGGEANRGSIFPLDAINQSRPLALDPIKAPVDSENIIGIASKLIDVDEKLRPVIELLFGHVIIVRDRKTARTIITSRNWKDMPDVRVVTLKGEMYLAGGPIITGASNKGLLARPRQHREIKGMHQQTLAEVEAVEAKQKDIEKVINAHQAQLEAFNVRLKTVADEQLAISAKIHSQEQRIAKIQNDLQWLENQKSRLESNIAEERMEVDQIKLNIGQLLDESKYKKIELNNLKADINLLPLEEFQVQSSYWTTNSAVIERALRDARNQHSERVARLDEAKQSLVALQNKTTQLEIEINALNQTLSDGAKEETLTAVKIDEIGNIVVPFEEQLNTLEKEHSELLSSDTEARQVLRAAEQRYTQAKINLARNQESFESIHRHIEDDFGLVAFDYSESVTGSKPLPLDGMVEELPKIEVLSPEIEETLRQQKAQIRRMGAINPEAQVEYQEVKSRYDFLTSQVDDLTKAEGDIKEVITELDMLMEREFKRTFEAVAQEFKQIFTRLFGGGSARLMLTEPENVTDTGIDIEARLPGRREQGLSLLSGGERSLTAAALIFSLLSVSPTPFCILDEVDAMLDEANVSRFRELITELSDQTQFIVITHNRNTVQAASIIYGVTMGRDSASQVISLRMDELGEEFGV